jgi:GTP-binding protein
LPGYGFAKVSKSEKENWVKLIEGYLTTNTNLAGLLLLLDCRRDPNNDDEQLIEWMKANEIPGLGVITKADKLNKDKLNRKMHQIEKNYGISTVPFSILSGLGKNELLTAIFNLMKK